MGVLVCWCAGVLACWCAGADGCGRVHVSERPRRMPSRFVVVEDSLRDVIESGEITRLFLDWFNSSRLHERLGEIRREDVKHGIQVAADFGEQHVPLEARMILLVATALVMIRQLFVYTRARRLFREHRKLD